MDSLLNIISTVEINPTELCNLRCSFCPRSTFYPNRNLNLDFETANIIKKHLDNIEFRGVVSITGRGEPTLHPEFDKLSDIFLKDRTYKLKINTNGAKVNKYIESIQKYDIVNMNYYKKDWQGFLDYMKLYTGREYNFFYKPPMDWDHNPELNFTNRAGSFEGEVYKGKCERVFEKLFIDWNGDYKLCCEDWKDHITLGNIKNESIKQYVEENTRLSSFRKMLIQGRRDLAPCSSCSYKTKCSESNFKEYSKLI